MRQTETEGAQRNRKVGRNTDTRTYIDADIFVYVSVKRKGFGSLQISLWCL